MLKKRIRTLDNICRLGIDAAFSFPQRQGIYLTNAFALVSIGIILCFLPFYYGWGIWATLTTAILAILALFLTIILNARKVYLPAKFLAVSVSCALLLVHGLEIGRESSVQMIYIPIMIGMIAIFFSTGQFFRQAP